MMDRLRTNFPQYAQALILAFLVLFGICAAAVSQESADGDAKNALPQIKDARVLSTAERARLVVDLTDTTEFAVATLDMPNRIVVDIKASALQDNDFAQPAQNGLIGNVSIEMVEAGRARATLTLNATAQVQQAYVLEPFDDQPARLVVDLIPDTPEQFAERAKHDLSAAMRGTQDIVDTSTPPGQSSVQLHTRPLIVLDPGHGGIDSGARAANGVQEKDIVLDFAKRLQEILVASDRFDVALTREDDTFLRLHQRVELARMNKADLFISIHADSFQDPDARGASVYTRDERATDSLDKVLAENENRADLVAGLTPPKADKQVVNILVDLMRRETRRQSYVAASSIVEQLAPSVRLRKFPVRQADFYVLQAPDVPSVLIELGFLSNDQDIANLLAGEWRDRTAKALARGISAYFDKVEQN